MEKKTFYQEKKNILKINVCSENILLLPDNFILSRVKELLCICVTFYLFLNQKKKIYKNRLNHTTSNKLMFVFVLFFLKKEKKIELNCIPFVSIGFSRVLVTLYKTMDDLSRYSSFSNSLLKNLFCLRQICLQPFEIY